jgi:hypothetical protein
LGFDGIDVDYEVSCYASGFAVNLADIKQYPENDSEADQFVDVLRRLRAVST